MQTELGGPSAPSMIEDSIPGVADNATDLHLDEGGLHSVDQLNRAVPW